MLRRDFWDKFNEVAPVQTPVSSDIASLLGDEGEITREDIIRELNSR